MARSAASRRIPPVRDGRTLADAAFISYEHWIALPDQQGPRHSRRTIPARLRRPLRRSHGVLAHRSRSRSQRSGLWRRGQQHDRTVAGAGDGQPRQGRGDPARQRIIAGFPTAGRWQFDIPPRAAVVGSGFYRHSTDLDPKSGSVGGAFGFAPTSRVSIWTEVDANLQTKAAGGRSWVVVNETSVEAYRGIWLKFSPQFRTPAERLGFPSCGAWRSPRTCCRARIGTSTWSYYHDRASVQRRPRRRC